MEEQNQKNQKRERSTAYPAFTLSEAIEFAVQLKKSLGKGPYGKVDASKGLGYKGPSGIALAKIAAMVHFGLLVRAGNTYAQSELANRINYQISEDDKNKAIIESVNMPKLYRDIATEFSGQAIPEQLGNILIRKGINPKVSEKAATTLQKSFEFAGLLKNGVLLAQPSSVNADDDLLDSAGAPAPIYPQEVPGNKGLKQIYNFTDSGEGWSLFLKSDKPLTSEVKRKLIDIAELLEKKV